jgi:thymidine phosphorylase
MLFVDVIRRKRNGEALDAEAVGQFVAGLADESLPAEQVSALAMAVFWRGMSVEEAGLLTRAMAESGRIMRWDAEALGGPVVDKHSTGGIGDKVSLVLAPLAAACGCFVPMISGRGLGHGGGTLDKVDSIPGYDAYPAPERLAEVVREAGCAIIGQTADLAPADRRLYAIRDVTATVESVPLITASILSKKIAAGLQGLVMDIKAGSGAFMSTVEEARTLARSIIGTAAASGLRTHALITDMNENLGRTSGNALEVAEAVAYLTGEEREPRFHAVVLELVTEMLLVGGLYEDRAIARNRVLDELESGAATERFSAMVAALGGPTDFVERAGEYLPAAPVQLPVHADVEGYLAAVDGRRLGYAVVAMGGGRRKTDDQLDLSVGFSEIQPIGTDIDPQVPLAVAHAPTRALAEQASHELRAACIYSEEPPAERPVVIERMTQG